jgi:hypothetical protein
LAELREIVGAPVVIAHHLNKQGVFTGSRAFITRCDLSVEATDGEERIFATKGRFLRSSDPIGENRWVVPVRDEHDGDDTQARSIVSCRFDGERPT